MMKKLVLGLTALLSAGILTAGSVDYLSNQSADFLRTFSRNASLDADAAVYNPAGTAFMAPGLTFALSNQSILKLYENDMNLAGTPLNSIVKPNSNNYKSTEPTLILPNGQVIWNGGPWAAYLAGGVVAGGGTAIYNDGVPYFVLQGGSALSSIQKGLNAALGASAPTITSVTVSGNITATSLYPQLTLGGAYAITDTVSLSLGLRSVYGYQSFVGQANYLPYAGTTPITSASVSSSVDVTKTALGFGGIAGADWKAYEGLLIAARFEMATPLEFKTAVNGGKSFQGKYVDGSTERRDLPALAGLGIRYDWQALSLTASGTGYFLGASKNGTYLANYDDFGWETGLSAEYAFLPGLLKASLGGMITKVGGNNKTYNDFDFSLDSSSIGGGVVYTALKDLDITLALSKTFYTDGSGQAIGTVNTTTYKKDAFTIDVGVQYKMF
jgi:long-chain fatty acid transport protein